MCTFIAEQRGSGSTVTSGFYLLLKNNHYNDSVAEGLNITDVTFEVTNNNASGTKTYVITDASYGTSGLDFTENTLSLSPVSFTLSGGSTQVITITPMNVPERIFNMKFDISDGTYSTTVYHIIKSPWMVNPG